MTKRMGKGHLNGQMVQSILDSGKTTSYMVKELLSKMEKKRAAFGIWVKESKNENIFCK